jgi:hypothetical protein
MMEENLKFKHAPLDFSESYLKFGTNSICNQRPKAGYGLRKSLAQLSLAVPNLFQRASIK